MADYDAIVIGAGHNGLAASALLARAGMRTLCLEAGRYAGGMASTVELFDGYRFEIAGSLQFPTSAVVSAELGLDTLPTIDLEVMSVSLRGVGDAPVVYYSDPMKMLAHLGEVHGADAVAGMAGLMAWSLAPTRALGRFDAGRGPRSLDEMYACAATESERAAIDDLLFGSVSDVLDRYLPDRDKHGALRGMLAFLAVNTTYRGPETPGSAAALAYGLAVPDENAMLMKKLAGGIGALTEHLQTLFTAAGGELRLRSAVERICVDSGRISGVTLADGTSITAPVVVSAIAPDTTVTELVDPEVLPAEVRERFTHVDHRGSYLQMHFALDGAPVFEAPYEMLNDPEMQAAIGLFSTRRNYSSSGRMPAGASCRPIRRSPSRSRPHTIRRWLRRGNTRPRRSRCGSRSNSPHPDTERRRRRWAGASSRRSPGWHRISNAGSSGTPPSPRATWGPCSALRVATTATA